MVTCNCNVNFVLLLNLSKEVTSLNTCTSKSIPLFPLYVPYL